MSDLARLRREVMEAYGVDEDDLVGCAPAEERTRRNYDAVVGPMLARLEAEIMDALRSGAKVEDLQVHAKTGPHADLTLVTSPIWHPIIPRAPYIP